MYSTNESTRARTGVGRVGQLRLAGLPLAAIAARAPRVLRIARVMAAAVAPPARLAVPGARAGSAGWLQLAVRSLARDPDSGALQAPGAARG